MQTEPFNQENAFERMWQGILQVKVYTDTGRKQVPAPHHRKQAWNKYRATVRSSTDHEKCLIALGEYQKSDRVKRGYVQDAGTWFGAWREWADLAKVAEPDALAAFDPVAFHGPRVAEFIEEHGDPDRSDAARELFNVWAGAAGDGAIFAEIKSSPAHDFWSRWKEVAHVG